MCKFEGYYDGPPIIPPRLKEMTIEELDIEIERLMREEFYDTKKQEE